MKKYFGWLLAAMTSLSLVSAFADTKVKKSPVDEEEQTEEVADVEGEVASADEEESNN